MIIGDEIQKNDAGRWCIYTSLWDFVVIQRMKNVDFDEAKGKSWVRISPKVCFALKNGWVDERKGNKRGNKDITVAKNIAFFQ